MKDLGIDYEQWIADLRKAEKDAASPEGMSVRDVAQVMGWPTERARRKIGEWVHAKLWAHVGRRQIVGIDGRVAYSPVYRPTKKGKKK